MGKGRLLIVDNRPDQIPFRRQALEREEYEVREAHSPEEAWKEFTSGLTHLAIVDIRLKDEDDEHDWSGLEWAESVHQQCPEFSCIILTAFPSYKAVQRARKPDAKGLPPAEDFIFKGEGLEILVKAVNNAFLNKVKIKPDLEIEFGGPLSCVCIANMIEFRRKVIEKAETEQLLLRSQEIRDLLCKMFYDCNRIVVYPLLAGRSKAAVLAVRPFSGSRPERIVVAKLGNRKDVEDEARSHHNYAERFVGTWAPAKKPIGSPDEPTAMTLHYGGLVYTVTGEGFEWTERFRDFYRANDDEKISKTLGVLLKDMRRGWYTDIELDKAEGMSAAFRRELELTPEHHSREQFVDTLRQLCNEARDLGLGLAIQKDKRTVSFQGVSSIPYPDPMAYVYDDVQDFGPALKCTTHGDFNGDNLLVDKKHGFVWLIDFARTGKGSALRDFAELESAIKFELVEETDLSFLYRFEQKLLSCTDLEDTPEPDPDMPPDLKKAMLVISALRKHIPGIVSLSDYLVSLLFHAAWMVVSEGSSPPSMGQTRPVTVRKTHALFSAAMLCDWLARGGPLPSGLVATSSLLQPTIITGITHLANAPVVASVRLRNYGAEPVTATVQWKITGFPSSSYSSAIALQRDEAKSFDYQPQFSPTAIRRIHERRLAKLRVKIARLTGNAKQPILDLPYDVYLLPRNVIAWTMKDPEGHEYDSSHYIGAWVTPEAKAVAQLQRGILDKHPLHVMVGYQAPDGSTMAERERIVREQIRAIYNYLKHDLKMAYADTSISFGSPAESQQIVRLPHETLKLNRSTANCIDATVLFASIIERFGMNPIIVLLPGHALLGWQTWSNSAKREYLETTVIDQMDFDDAMKLGKAKRDEAYKQGVVEELSLWRLREDGIDSMPVEED
jgi:DNA-binding NarL/FixJ family response regulator